MSTANSRRSTADLADKLGFETRADYSQAGHSEGLFTFAMMDPAALEPAPINPDWILEGTPEARCLELSAGTRRSTNTAHWSCTKGRFRWYYGCDETVLFLEGEVIVTDESGTVYHGKPGVSLFFPAGTSAVWEVPSYIRKIAFNHQPVHPLLNFMDRAYNKLCRMAGLSKTTPCLGLDAKD